MPQDDKKRLKQRLEAAAALSKDKVKASEFAAARKKAIADYSGASKAKSGPVLDTNNSAGAVQYLRERARGLSSPALQHAQSAEQERMRKRDTPLSATPDLNSNK